MRTFVALQILCLSTGVALAQSGPTYRLEELTMNAGGHPADGVGLTSSSYRMSLDALGEASVAPRLRGSVYSMDAGFARCFPPPAEVQQVVVLADKTTFAWAPDPSVGAYRVYFGDVRNVRWDEGTCLMAGIDPEFTTPDHFPEPGETFFYLITAQNTLLEEGTTGYDSAGTPRDAPVPCP